MMTAAAKEEAATQAAIAFLEVHRNWLRPHDRVMMLRMEEGKPLVSPWLELAIEGGGRQGASPLKFLHRDHCIAEAVWLVTKYGFKATRNRATSDKGGKPSACSIVSEALKRCGVHMDESNVMRIWGYAPLDLNPQKQPKRRRQSK